MQSVIACRSCIASLLLTFGLSAMGQTCAKTFSYNSTIDKPTLQPFTRQSTFIEGKAGGTLAVGAKIRLCVLRKGVAPIGPFEAGIGANGGFSFSTPALEPDDSVAVQVIYPDSPPTYGPESDTVSVHDSCKATAKSIPNQAAPSIAVSLAGGNSTITGKLLEKDPDTLRVRLCVNDIPTAENVTPAKNGVFSFAKRKLNTGDIYSAQIVDPSKQEPQAASDSISAPNPTADDTNRLRYIFVGGVEQSGYSSLTTSTEPFIQLYLEGPEHRAGRRFYFDPWGRIRLLGAPQPSTNGIASTFTDPTGTITKLDFTKVGQALDVVGGEQFFLSPPSFTFGQISATAWAGTTTTLSSQNVAYTFKTPAAGTTECQELLARFNPLTGYRPGLQVDPSGKSCVANGSTAVTDLAFANQDRTNFLFKWGVGLRMQGTLSCKTSKAECLGQLSLLDVSVGQDATITRGLVRHFVAKADGLLAIPTGGGASYLYLFGSVYTRFTRNQNSAPLILAAETTQPTLPSPSVIVLPLVQPDRDFFRLGVGLNLTQIFAKFFSGSSTTP